MTDEVIVNLSVKDAAALLSVSEKTIYRWIKREIVPAYRIHESYRFNRAELIEWATSRRLGVAPAVLDEPDTSTLPLPALTTALETGGVFYRIGGRNRDEVLADVVAHLRLPDEVDRAQLLQILIAREKLASTAVGDGIAVPHPRNPVYLHVTRPTVTLCFLETPVDFQSLDGRPVRILLTVVAPTLRSHLHLLARINFVLRDPGFRAVLETEGSREEIFAALTQAEAVLHRPD